MARGQVHRMWQKAEQYQDKINNIFDHLSILIHQDTKTGSFGNHTKFQKGHHQTMGTAWGQPTWMWY